ncbi:MAG: NTP transferase domain-containing protein [Candidatus Roizmanbacteria bacterium]|nr:MAG: NTP transferase domain-containing protein [Candidatus Roizmanbacteria bacterium]
MVQIDNILLLAGGDSTRFWPLKEKNLMKYLGKTLIVHQIDQLAKKSDRLIIVAGIHNKEAIEKIVEQQPEISGCAIEIILQNEKLEGQGGAVLSAKGKVNGDVLICNTNDIFDYSFIDKLAETKEKKDFIFLAKKVNEYFPGGYVEFDENNKIKGIIEKPDPEKVPSDITKLVVDYFADFEELTSALEKVTTDKDDWYEQALCKIIEKTNNSDYLLYDSYWYTIKYPWHILDMNNYFLSQIKQTYIDKSSLISKNAVLEGMVHIGKNVKIGDFAKIVGPCFIGEGTVIGDFTMIRASHIGSHSLIGGYSEVTRSYLGERVMLHRNYVGDSVLADDVLMGAGAVTANYRFDEKMINSMSKDRSRPVPTNRQKLGAIIGKKTKIGVNNSIYPGIKIGSFCLVAPQGLVDSDVEDNVYLIKGVKKRNELNR